MHQTLTKTFDYYKFWNERNIEARFGTNVGYVTILGLYIAEEKRKEEADKFIS